MPVSQRGVRIGQGVSSSAESRRCPECGRRGALVEAWKAEGGKVMRGEVCHWARDSNGRLCSYPGVFIVSALNPQ